MNFEIAPGESLGLVGESGSGKTTAGRILAGLETATGGNIFLRDGDNMLNVADIAKDGMKRFRRRGQMFIDRCPWVTEHCRSNPHPELVEVSRDHFVACYVVEQGH